MTDGAIPPELLDAIWNLEGAGAELVELARDFLLAEDDPDLRDEIGDSLVRWRLLLDGVIERIEAEGAAIDGAAGPGAAQRLLKDVAGANEPIEHLWLVGRRRPKRRVDAFLRWARRGGPKKFDTSVNSVRQHRMALAAASMAPVQEPKKKRPSKRGRRGRTRQYDPKVDDELLNAWKQAKSAGVSREQFMADRGRTVADLANAQARRRKRGSSTKRTKRRRDKS